MKEKPPDLIYHTFLKLFNKRFKIIAVMLLMTIPLPVNMLTVSGTLLKSVGIILKPKPKPIEMAIINKFLSFE